jgi:L-aminopeptidase/D-esterase-like protein
MLDLITDVAGIWVGNTHDADMISGTTALVFDAPCVASVAVPGGAPAGRDLGCLEPDAAVERIDAIVLSGGSGFGLDAASGVQAWLRESGRGFRVGAALVPIVPAAICFDLNNGGNKDWGRHSPYRELGYMAAQGARPGPFPLGTVGAGYGASTVDVKGGLGSASATTSAGHTVAAIVAVNALGSALIGDGPHFWAAALERGSEYGGLGFPARTPSSSTRLDWKGRSASDPSTPPATTIACVATDAILDKAQAKRLAISANAGLARGLRLSHAVMDGDTIFAVSTTKRPLTGGIQDLIEIGALGADCISRAIARAVYEARTPVCHSGGRVRWQGPPAWHDRFTAFSPGNARKS